MERCQMPVSQTPPNPMDFSALRKEASSAPKARVKEIYQEVAEHIMAAIVQLEPHPD